MPEDLSYQPTAVVVTVSTRCVRGETEDRSGSVLQTGLAEWGIVVNARHCIADDLLRIQQVALEHTDTRPVDLLVFTGGTGPTPDDRTPEALLPLLDRRFDALAIALTAAGQTQTPRAPLSRTIVGTRGRSVIMALPGSPGGAGDALMFLKPILEHLLSLVRGDHSPH